MGDSPDCLEAAATGYIAMAALYIVMTALYTAMTAFYTAMAIFYTAMAAIYYLEHSRMLCSPKVSSSNFSQNRTDPLTLDPYLLMATMKQPTSKKDKLAITSTLFKMETTFAARRDRITIFEEPRCFSMEKTEKVMTTYTPAQLKCASAPDKLVPFTMVLAILFLDHKLVPFTMVSAIQDLYHELATNGPRQAMLHTRAMLHTCAMLDPILDTVPSHAMLHTHALMEPVLDTVPTKPPCTPSPRSPPWRTSTASAASLPRSTAASQSRKQRGRGRRRGRTSGPASSQLG